MWNCPRSIFWSRDLHLPWLVAFFLLGRLFQWSSYSNGPDHLKNGPFKILKYFLTKWCQMVGLVDFRSIQNSDHLKTSFIKFALLNKTAKLRVVKLLFFFYNFFIIWTSPYFRSPLVFFGLHLWGDIFSDHLLWSIFQSLLHTYYTFPFYSEIIILSLAGIWTQVLLVWSR